MTEVKTAPVKKEPSILKLGIVLFIITFCVALLLSIINALTKDQIAYQAELETQAAINTIYPDAARTEALTVPTSADPKVISEMYVATAENGDVIGYAVKSSPNGFAGPIDLMVGVLPDSSIKSVCVLSTNSETPGLGTEVAKPFFIDQYQGKETPIEVVKKGTPTNTEILAISGATISSRAVTNGVNLATEAVNALSGEPAVAPEATTTEGGEDVE